LRNEIKDENCVDFCLDNKTDYFITNHQLYEINTAKQKVKRSLTLKQRLSKVAINSDSSLIALGGTSIDIVDVKSWKVVASLSGHATEIQDLVFGQDGCLYSCAKDDRFISAWTLSDKKSKGILYIVICIPDLLSVNPPLY
jgi:WD40 repeat protein